MILYSARTNFVLIAYNYVQIHAHGRHTGMPGLPALCFGHYFAVVGLFGVGFFWMMDDEDPNCGMRFFLSPTSYTTQNLDFSRKNIKLGAWSCEYACYIQRTASPPFTKGTHYPVPPCG